MGGDIGEIKLGSERELYKYINHYVAVKRGKKYIYIYIYILVQVNIIFALPDYSSGVIEVETRYLPLVNGSDTYNTSHSNFGSPSANSCSRPPHNITVSVLDIKSEHLQHGFSTTKRR